MDSLTSVPGNSGEWASQVRGGAAGSEGDAARLRSRLEVERLLHQSAEAANEARSPEEAVQRILEVLCERVPCRAAEILLLDGDQVSLVHRCKRNEGFHSDTRRESLEETQPAVRKAIQEGAAGWIEARAPGSSEPPGRPPIGAVAPIFVGSAVEGALVTYFRDPSQGEVAFLVTLETISRQIGEVLRRSKIETALRASEEKLSLLAEAGRVLVSSLDYSDTLTSVARLAVRALADWCIVYLAQPDGSLRRVEVAHGDPHDEALADRLRAQPLPEELPYPIHEVFRSGETAWVTDLRDRSGSHRPRDLLQHLGAASFVAVPLKVRGTTLGAMALISKDPRRRYGTESIQVAEKLATLCALAIDSARLYGEARQATLRRDEILHMVSHDLRNPLAAIQMGVNRLLKDCPTPERRDRSAETLRRIQRSSKQMSRLIEDLLDLGYLEQGRLALQREPVSALQLARDAADRYQRFAEDQAVELVVDCNDDVVVDVDPHRAGQLLGNLVDNAIRYGADGGLVTIQLAALPHAVHYSVIDRGPGIAPQLQDEIFDPYVQARASGRAGAGLGLAIAKRIVEAHDGSIWVESEPGAGTVFNFTLPRLDP